MGCYHHNTDHCDYGYDHHSADGDLDTTAIQRGFCRQKHCHKNTDTKIRAEMVEKPAGNPRKTTNNR